MGSIAHERPSITVVQAQQIVRKHLRNHESYIISKFTEIVNEAFSFSSGLRTYILDLSALEGISAPPCSCFLTIASPSPKSGTYHTNSLPIVYQILERIRTNTDFAIPQSTLDLTLTDIPYHFILSPTTTISSSDMIPLSKARKDGLLSEKENVLIDLQLGAFLGQLHSRVQNDWYGVPELQEPMDASYNWQESFTSFLEDLLCEVELKGLALPYEDIRRYLSRAIGFFLFDDVEVPSLIWFTGSDDDIFISKSGHPSISFPSILAILPNVTHALWGDPLLECFFLSPNPSAAMLAGYNGSGGGPLTLFPRQKTKRIWYTLFLSLVMLQELGITPKDGEDEHSPVAKRRIWCKETVTTCVEALKDAPCY